MTGIIDVGGGMKCAYSAGLYDYFMDNDIKFDYYLGVSAGSMNLLSLIAGERGRNIEMYRRSATENDYLSLTNYLHNGTLMNYDKVRDTFFATTGDKPFNFEKFFQTPENFVISATRSDDGRTVYFDKSMMTDRDRTLDFVSASCCLPIISKPIVIDGVKYFDGGIAEPIPLARALADGCTKLIVVLSSPVEARRENFIGMNFFGGAALKDYPVIADEVEDRAAVYNYMIRRLRDMEREDKALIFSPDEIHGAATLVRDVEVIDQLYDNGYRDALNAKTQIIRFLEA